jgi:hypothetical protein
MRLHSILGLAGAIVLLPALANAQDSLGQATPAPNPYNRNTQPLSPYLNLLRGGNVAANYFYGVRPSQMGSPLASPLAMGMGTQGRQTFFPQIDTLYELEDSKPTDGLKPTGHPFGFNNGMGYFGNGQGTRGGGQPQGAGARRGTGLR